jgi:Zn-dependent protease with chaperone function
MHTSASPISPAARPPSSPHDPTIAVNDLAAAYQPRRVWAAAITISWNLVLVAAFVAEHGASRLYHWLRHFARPGHAAWIAPAYFGVFFAAYLAINYPVELWFGYLEERQFGLAKDGIRAWTRDWLVGSVQHAALFIAGSCLLIALQRALPIAWLPALTAALLCLFLLTSYFAVELLPGALFHFEPIADPDRRRLESLAAPLTLPPIIVFSHPSLRDFSGGPLGLANRQKLLLSRSTLNGASESVLRFVLRHDLGHRHYHHLLLATLAGWAWAALGLLVSDSLIEHVSPLAFGRPPYIAWLALTFSAWMAAGEPLLAYLGRRLEYQADRFYLRNGGTLEEMQTALEELSRRNLARTETLRRRHTMFHPLPSVWNRLHAAKAFERRPRQGGTA